MTPTIIRPTIRKYETARQAAARNATDALYTARDSGLDMHRAAEAVVDVVIATLELAQAE